MCLHINSFWNTGQEQDDDIQSNQLLILIYCYWHSWLRFTWFRFLIVGVCCGRPLNNEGHFWSWHQDSILRWAISAAATCVSPNAVFGSLIFAIKSPLLFVSNVFFCRLQGVALVFLYPVMHFSFFPCWGCIFVWCRWIRRITLCRVVSVALWVGVNYCFGRRHCAWNSWIGKVTWNDFKMYWKLEFRAWSLFVLKAAG